VGGKEDCGRTLGHNLIQFKYSTKGYAAKPTFIPEIGFFSAHVMKAYLVHDVE
jgi:hypothetical protein